MGPASSCKRVGRWDMDRASQRKSSKAEWNSGVSRRRLPVRLLMACCKWLKRPREPGNARDMERSSPSSWCQDCKARRR